MWRLSEQNGQTSSCDIAFKQEGDNQQCLAGQIYRLLAQKGFCTLHLGDAAESLREALFDVEAVNSAGSFYQPHEVLHAGLLGEAGSARIARLEAADSQGLALRSINQRISSLGYSLEPWTSDLGFSMHGRSPMFLHDSRDLEASDYRGEPKLEESCAMEWLDWYAWARLKILLFLGPSSGVVELQPEDNELLPLQISIEPGTWLVLRPNLLSITFKAKPRDQHEGCYVASAWFLGGAGVSLADSELGQRRCCRDLWRWLSEQLERRFKERQDKKPELDIVPRRVEQTINRLFQRQRPNQTAVIGMSWTLQGGLEGVGGNLNVLASGLAGCDFVESVPLTRWDHAPVYDASAVDRSPVDKIYTKHGAFATGLGLFDNKFFDLSRNDGANLCPQEMRSLENGYLAMANAGHTKKSLRKALIGVYLGITNSETRMHDDWFGAGSDSALCCGRVSFCLGLNGPTMSLDSEASSALLAVYQAAHTLNAKQPINNQAFAGASYYQMVHSVWLMCCQMHHLSRRGRCSTFDASADGFSKGEGSAGLFLQALTEEVDGQSVLKDTSGKIYGIIASEHTQNDGRTASLSAPNGPALQELLHATTERAGISPLDVDTAEINGIGTLLNDAIETSAAAITLRNRVSGSESALLLGAVKTNHAQGLHVSGMSQLLKVLSSTSSSLQTPNQHLREINPHMDTLDIVPIAYPQETLPYTRLDCIYSSVTARGFGGACVSLLCYSQVERSSKMRSTRLVEMPITFWPGGGGELEDEAVPERTYTIIGSWDGYSKPEDMQWEGDGTYGYTVTLSENRFEHFKILLDGNAEKVLHPGFGHAPKGVPAFFSTASLSSEENAATAKGDEGVGGFNWLIDGRDRQSNQEDQEHSLGKPVTHNDEGRPGDHYRVYLHVSGRHQMVDWKKLPRKVGVNSFDIEVPTTSRYHVARSQTQWSLEQMNASPSAPGTFYLEISLEHEEDEFLIVRNEDWNQVLYPAAIEGEVAGPDFGAAFCPGWKMEGRPGDVFCIELERFSKKSLDVKRMTVKKKE